MSASCHEPANKSVGRVPLQAPSVAPPVGDFPRWLCPVARDWPGPPGPCPTAMSRRLAKHQMIGLPLLGVKLRKRQVGTAISLRGCPRRS